ncbi:hypothetical protein QEZ54_19265 [Catellatospora sp. KI3]|uniref:hypothetical protein n=1 Tax=Catellatospora sp. KI3 TaxID=3041620 RepID=UPI002482CA31|nr:hypothetical protein [Catellatospora sp. KI3]MDI1463122.1 hypothetical protein [Catellatospora sp. KI3]
MARTPQRPVTLLWLGTMMLAALTGCAGQAADGPASAPAGASAPSSATASAPGSPSPSAAAPSPAAVPPPDHAFMLQAVDRVEDPVLTVTASGRIGTYPGGADTGDRERFVLSPLSPGATTYLLKTAVLRVGGEPWCVGVKGDQPYTMACDAADRDQRVTLPPGATAATYGLVLGQYDVEVGQDGKISLVRHRTGAKTVFRFIAAGTVGQWP